MESDKTAVPNASEDEEEWSFVVGTIGDELFEIPESEYDMYEEFADDEGMSLDECISALEECAPLLLAIKQAQVAFQKMAKECDSKGSLPPQEVIDAVAQRVIEGQAAIDGEFPYEHHLTWVPECAESIRDSCRMLTDLLDKSAEYEELMEEARTSPGGDEIVTEVADAQRDLHELADELISHQQSYFEAIPGVSESSAEVQFDPSTW